LSLQSAVQKLDVSASQGASQKLVAASQSLSSSDNDSSKANIGKRIENKVGKSLSGAAWHVLSKIEKWCAVQGLNLQKPHLRPCLPVMLTVFHRHSLPVE
jgi:hypothetical protein